MKKRIKNIIKEFALDYFFILVGCALMALSLVLFLSPNKIAAGGVSGLSIVLHYLFKIPIGITMLVFNVPLFVLGVHKLGKRFGVKTIFGMCSFSFFTDFFDVVLKIKPFTNDMVLASIYGGILLGIGLGIVFRRKGSTGGSDIIAQIFSHHNIMSAGNTFMMIDFFVISIAGLVFQGIEYSLWGFIALYISSKIVDVLIEGLGYAKASYIISDKADEIKDTIIKEMNRGVTILKGEGPYTKTEKKIILCIVTRREISKLSRLAKEIDPSAFMIISDVYEVLGKGFKRRAEFKI